MKESIGNSFLMTLAIVFSFIIMSIIIGVLAYTKAYKAKNKIIGVIEKYNGYTDQTEEDIYMDLNLMGYRVNGDNQKCPPAESTDEVTNMRLLHDISPGRYEYCVYEVKTTRGYYYHVITFTHFDIPAIGQYLVFQVKGDSQVIYWNFDGEFYIDNP